MATWCKELVSLEKTLKDWRQGAKGTTEDKMVGWHHWLNGHEFEQGLGDGQEHLFVLVTQGVTKSWTQPSDWTIDYQSVFPQKHHRKLTSPRCLWWFHKSAFGGGGVQPWSTFTVNIGTWKALGDVGGHLERELEPDCTYFTFYVWPHWLGCATLPIIKYPSKKPLQKIKM